MVREVQLGQAAEPPGLMVGEVKPETPPPPPPLPGEFVIQPLLTHTYLTAVWGGGRTTDATHTDATQIGSWEKFRLLGGARYGPSAGEYAIQTVNGSSSLP